MVGSESGAQEFRKLLIRLSMNSYTSIEYWEKKSLITLPSWLEALAEGAEK